MPTQMELSDSTPEEVSPELGQQKSYRFPSIRPLLPPVAEWSGFLDRSYAQRWFSNFGPLVRQFEGELTDKFCHAEEAIVSANSATSGIAAALIALHIQGPVVVPAYTFPATGSAVLMAGAEPVVMDVDLATWSLSPRLLEDFLAKEKCAAVVLVSPFGLRRDFSKHLALCQRYDIPVVIDSAAGLSEKSEPLVAENCFEVYSLHATKPFPVGEGGAIRAHRSQEAALRRALNFGLEAGRARSGCWGINGKLPEVSAAVGLAVLRTFEAIIRHRRTAAQVYIQLLSEYDGLNFPTEARLSPWQVFPVLLPSALAAEEFIAQAAARSLQVRWSYKPTLDCWPHTSRRAPLPNAESLSQRMVTLPVYSDINENELSAITAIVRQSLDSALRL